MALLEFNDRADGLDFISTETLASVTLLDDEISVKYLSGQYDRFKGKHTNLGAVLKNSYFVEGIDSDGNRTFVNVGKAQRVQVGSNFQLSAQFSKDEYSHRNRYVQVRISEDELARMRSWTRFRQPQVKGRVPKEGEHGPIPVYL